MEPHVKTCKGVLGSLVRVLQMIELTFRHAGCGGNLVPRLAHAALDPTPKNFIGIKSGAISRITSVTTHIRGLGIITTRMRHILEGLRPEV